jgi:hypothetical protein
LIHLKNYCMKFLQEVLMKMFLLNLLLLIKWLFVLIPHLILFDQFESNCILELDIDYTKLSLSK